jgi:hypothetical protein
LRKGARAGLDEGKKGGATTGKPLLSMGNTGGSLRDRRAPYPATKAMPPRIGDAVLSTEAESK